MDSLIITNYLENVPVNFIRDTEVISLLVFLVAVLVGATSLSSLLVHLGVLLYLLNTIHCVLLS